LEPSSMALGVGTHFLELLGVPIRIDTDTRTHMRHQLLLQQQRHVGYGRTCG